jgi:hypothetical protein
VTDNDGVTGGSIFNDGAMTVNDSSRIDFNTPDNCAPRGSVPICTD